MHNFAGRVGKCLSVAVIAFGVMGFGFFDDAPSPRPPATAPPPPSNPMAADDWEHLQGHMKELYSHDVDNPEEHDYDCLDESLDDIGDILDDIDDSIDDELVYGGPGSEARLDWLYAARDYIIDLGDDVDDELDHRDHCSIGSALLDFHGNYDFLTDDQGGIHNHAAAYGLGGSAAVNFLVGPRQVVQANFWGQSANTDYGDGYRYDTRYFGFSGHYGWRERSNYYGLFGSWGHSSSNFSSTGDGSFVNIGTEFQVRPTINARRDELSLFGQFGYTWSIGGDVMDFLHERAWYLHGGARWFPSKNIMVEANAGYARVSGYYGPSYLNSDFYSGDWRYGVKVEYKLSDSPIGIYAAYSGLATATTTHYYYGNYDSSGHKNALIFGIQYLVNGPSLSAIDLYGPNKVDYNPLFGTNALGQ